MCLANRLRRILDGLPPGSLVSLPVDQVRLWLEEAPGSPPGPERHLTVEEVAEVVGRAPGTVRTWIREGKLAAYRQQGREYRVRPEDLRTYQDAQAHPSPSPRETEEELDEWWEGVGVR